MLLYRSCLLQQCPPSLWAATGVYKENQKQSKSVVKCPYRHLIRTKCHICQCLSSNQPSIRPYKYFQSTKHRGGNGKSNFFFH